MTNRSNIERLRSTLDATTNALLSEQNPKGFWHGELSSSSLSTAVALIALHRMGDSSLIFAGLRWLADHANEDGGWGDTVRSRSNLSTTALVWAAFGATGQDANFSSVVNKAEQWLWKVVGHKENLPRAIIENYGKDRTFSVPILMTLALSGRLDSEGWCSVIPLPFELAVLPQSWFGALQLPVVSYALPALIAIGQAIHHHSPSRNPLARFIRHLSKERTLRTLIRLQPSNGGFLEATPLTAFVTMSLASIGQQLHPVSIKGASFLRASVRPDGSWPIDTNLATWVTTLAVKSLAHQPNALSAEQKRSIREWLLNQQFPIRHAYTGALPGGWAWTDLPGGVPDADDTAGALVALHHLGHTKETIAAAESGLNWLLGLQNRDGGIPTFCRGWGTLPFDQSAPEITCHTMQAFACWQASVQPELARNIAKALHRAERFLMKNQRSDGSWIPLWFGNEESQNHENPVYGTARTLIGLNVMRDAGYQVSQQMLARAAQYLSKQRTATGGWGGAAGASETIEETAVAAEALSDLKGGLRLADMLGSTDFSPAPIGLYFARLWYFERLYPTIFAAGALGSICSKEL